MSTITRTDKPPHTRAPFIPTAKDFHVTYYGVPVALLDEESNTTLAVTADKRQAIAALNRYAREMYGWAGLAHDPDATIPELRYSLKEQRVVFQSPDEDADEDLLWHMRPAADGDEHAVTVFVWGWP